jgi:hypothetical protein
LRTSGRFSAMVAMAPWRFSSIDFMEPDDMLEA